MTEMGFRKHTHTDNGGRIESDLQLASRCRCATAFADQKKNKTDDASNEHRPFLFCA
jgi:hypothetical protein